MTRNTGLLFNRIIPSLKRASCHVRSLSNGSYFHNPGTEPLEYSTLGEVIADTANKYPGRVAVRSVHENVSITYEQLLKQADSFGCILRAQGLEKGDRVGIWSHNTSAYIVALVAAARVGLIAVTINPVYEKPELSFCLRKTGLKALLVGNQIGKRDYLKTLNELLPEMSSCTPGELESKNFPMLRSVITMAKDKTDGLLNFEQLTTGGSSNIGQYQESLSPDDGSIIHFTSGTTGEPKAALDSHFGIVNNTHYVGQRMTLHEEHHSICLQAPLFHALATVISVFSSLKHGSTIVISSPTYDINANINAVYAEKCTVLTGTPTMYVDMVHQIRKKGDGGPPALRVALAGGSPLTPQLVHHIKQYMNVDSVKNLYGLTETTASVFLSVPEDSIEVVTQTVGFLQDHLEVKVVDENNKIVPFGSPGELLVRGYSTMLEYWDEPEKTKQTLGADGWLRTGDKFTISDDGYGRVVGRIKDIIVRGGENIAPLEIEDLLNTHPDVIESQVIGVEDERLGEELCAVVRLHHGASMSPADVTKHLSGKLAKFKIPRILKLIEEFPKTASGKIQKFRLKEMVEKGQL